MHGMQHYMSIQGLCTLQVIIIMPELTGPAVSH
jgi:hypothetical protein